MLSDSDKVTQPLIEVELEKGPKYVVPMAWYMSYNLYKQGGPAPGRIYFSEILNKHLELDEKAEENIDFKVISCMKWNFFRDTFGSFGELLYVSKDSVRSQYIKIEPDDDTVRNSTEQIILPEKIIKT
jgi:hypothetical protein